jgi:hypothetical protein
MLSSRVIEMHFQVSEGFVEVREQIIRPVATIGGKYEA